LLEVLDEVARPKVINGAFDEIFVGRTPVLMGVEPASLCWVLGQVADNREGQTWADALQSFPALEYAITDAGSGLMKGLALCRASRTQPLEHTLDVFHTLHEGGRAWRITESRVWKANARAEQLRQTLRRLKRQGKETPSHCKAADRAGHCAELALNSAIEIETAWRHVRESLELFTPEGELNTAAAARAQLAEWLPELKGPQWAKTIRLLERPQSLTFLKRIERKLQDLPLADELKRDALRFEGLRRRPTLLKGEDPPARATRGWWLLATVRYHRDEEFQKAVLSVQAILRGCWRASSLVEGINSIVRMQQARHRKLTPALINLKRFYWNCRRFRTGRRSNQSPYELLGILLPPGSWWDLLKLSPDELRQKLSTKELTP
jgi:hypothetical protein